MRYNGITQGREASPAVVVILPVFFLLYLHREGKVRQRQPLMPSPRKQLRHPQQSANPQHLLPCHLDTQRPEDQEWQLLSNRSKIC